MADKSNQLILDALTRAAADPAGLPLFAGKNAPGLFAGTAPAKQAARRCKDDDFLRVLRVEKRGKATQEICALTDKGLEYLLRQVNPRQVLEDLVRAVESRREQLDALLASARETQNGLDAFRAMAEKVLRSVNGKERVEDLYAAWSNRAPAEAAADPAPTLLARLAHWRDTGATGDCPLPELFQHARQALPELSVGHFHDALRQLHERGQIYLHPWTGPLSELPEPACALLVGHEIAYYASNRTAC